MSEISEGFDNIRNLTNFSFKRLFSIEFLNDPELRDLDKKLRETFNNEMEYAFSLRMRFLHNTDFDKEAAEHRKSQFNSKISKILGDMQRRLELISQNALLK